MINVVNIWHHYGIRPILRNVSLHVEPSQLGDEAGIIGTASLAIHAFRNGEIKAGSHPIKLVKKEIF